MTKELARIEEKSIADAVYNRVIELQVDGAIDFPSNYSVGNALKSAFLILQETKTKDNKLAIEVCTQSSIFNALLDMVVQGLNPAKEQCYFIPYGDQLTLRRSYLGTIAITKRLDEVKDVKGYAVYKGDNLELGFDLMTGKKIVKNFEPTINNDPKDLIGALAIIIGDNEILHVEYMDMSQIKNAWDMGSMKGESKSHRGFPDQMAIRSVINRACKMYANTSDDSGNISNLINKTDTYLEAEIEENANRIPLENVGVVDTETGEIIEEPEEIVAPF